MSGNSPGDDAVACAMNSHSKEEPAGTTPVYTASAMPWLAVQSCQSGARGGLTGWIGDVQCLGLLLDLPFELDGDAVWVLQQHAALHASSRDGQWRLHQRNCGHGGTQARDNQLCQGWNVEGVVFVDENTHTPSREAVMMLHTVETYAMYWVNRKIVFQSIHQRLLSNIGYT